MKSMQMSCINAVLVFLVALFPTAGMAETPEFKRIFVFGDSLSDIGNDRILSGGEIPPPTRFYKGRFSNGMVWVDQLANDLGIKKKKFFPSLDRKLQLNNKGHSANYAYGGSGTSEENKTPPSTLFPDPLTVRGLSGQVEDFLAGVGSVADPKALYVVWSGANDYLLPPGTEGIAFPPNPEYTTGNIIAAIERLNMAGAQHFLVLSLPDLGNIPITGLLGLQESATWLTLFHNWLLQSKLAALSAQLSEDIVVYYVDTYSLYGAISDPASAFGFSNTFTDLGPASNCLIELFQPQDCSKLPGGMQANGSVFWDSQHPTKALHRYTALKVYQCLDSPDTCRVAGAQLPGI